MRALGLVVALVLLAYPLLVYFGGRWLEPKWLGLAIVSLYLLRLLLVARALWQRVAVLGVLLALVAALWWRNDEVLLKLLPALINAAMAVYFAYTLYHPPTLPARLAILEHGSPLPAPVQSYTTWVTRLWVGFFLLNGSIAAWTALWGSREVWALYNGLIAYGIMGVLFAAEFGYRQCIFRKKHGL
ncbi:hypothetical protein [Gilvimarinus algae]|uniref:Strain DSM n=1 Tax=Gilvimarinus algae TaxID=3058037 RepID=A0ABT8TH86_9GAMM|nr:hypothetical protein [Gilvimarinus sp. SDUM040014]MDO3383459.1 hypothetical protein [Gilvimarinus sp. SDUM040014]